MGVLHGPGDYFGRGFYAIMGIMACDRLRCPGILCKRFSYTFGYICESCFKELVDLGPTMDIEEFMESKKGVSEFTNDFEKRLDAEFSMETL